MKRHNQGLVVAHKPVINKALAITHTVFARQCIGFKHCMFTHECSYLSCVGRPRECMTCCESVTIILVDD